jgi:hypothetical protein
VSIAHLCTQITAKDFARLAQLGQLLGLESVREETGHISQKAWTALRNVRGKVNVLSKAFATERQEKTLETADDGLSDIFRDLGVDGGAEVAECEVARAPLAEILPLTADPKCGEYLKLCESTFLILTTYNHVPALYLQSGKRDPTLTTELLRLFELASIGTRQSGQKQAIFGGTPGIGKTTMMLYIAAIAAVCFPHILTVYWTWETPLHAGDDAETLTPPCTVSTVLSTAFADPALLCSETDFALAVEKHTRDTTIQGVIARAGQPIVFLGDELQNVYETVDTFAASAVALIGQLRHCGKQPDIYVALSGSSTRMQEYTIDTPQELRSKGIVDLNHGTYHMHHIYPPRDAASINDYVKGRFPRRSVDADIILHHTGGVGRDVGNFMMYGRCDIDKTRLLAAVGTRPALRAWFIRFAALYPTDKLQAAVAGGGALPVVSIPVADALHIAVDSGESDALKFMKDMQARGIIFCGSGGLAVQPMRPSDVVDVLVNFQQDPRIPGQFYAFS